MKMPHIAVVPLAWLAATLMLVSGAAAPASAALPTQLLVTVSDSPDPASSGGQVIYTINVKNDGTVRARNVVVTISLPQGTQFVKCSVSVLKPCTLSAGTVTTNLGIVRAHQQVKISLTLTMPAVSQVSTLTVTADANGTGATADKNSATTTILPPGNYVTYLPSGRVTPIACGDTLAAADFGSDTTAKLTQGLGCASEPFGLKITASGKTLDLNQFKIVGATAKGNIGIVVSNATDVTIIGGSTSGSSGLEFFDWCVKDEGDSARLSVNTLRCFRARTAGIDTISDGVTLTNLLIDKAVATSTTTAEPPGGVGIHTRGDNVHIKNTVVRRTGYIGIWAEGSDADADGLVALIDGNTSTMRVENSSGYGIVLDGGPHSVKDASVTGDGSAGVSKDGVVIGLTGIGNLLDGVVVKQHAGNGFVVNGTSTRISRSNVEDVGLDGFVSAGGATDLSGDGVQTARHGFVINGDDNTLESNGAEQLTGDGYVVSGARADLSGNSAQNNGARGYVIGGSAGILDTNTSESNADRGFLITGSDYTLKGNRAKRNGNVGFEVSGGGNSFNTNAAERNAGAEWVIGPGNIDDGGNKVNGSTFSFTTGGGTFN